MAEGRRFILILDEFPYAVESDNALPSELQNAWDHDLKGSNLVLVIAGSHVGMMVKMQEYQAPLYGRFTARLPVEPLPFAALADFLPDYDAAQRVAVYAILGGIPAYLKRFDSHRSLAANIQEQILLDTGMFRVEPFYLLSDEVREPRNYMAVLRAIGEGNHTLEEITLGSGLQTKQHTSTYLGRLQELRLVYRDTPATIPEGKLTTQGRYALRDAYLRFYFRFIAPHERLLEQGLTPRLWEIIQEQLRAFIGGTAFEDLLSRMGPPAVDPRWIAISARSCGEPLGQGRPGRCSGHPLGHEADPPWRSQVGDRACRSQGPDRSDGQGGEGSARRWRGLDQPLCAFRPRRFH